MLDVTPAAITQYEQGKTRPGRATLAALSLQLSLPPAFFVPSGQSSAAVETAPHFRSLRSTTRTTRLHLLARLRLLSELIDLVDEHVALPPVDVPRLDVAPGRAAAAEAAREVRERWGFGDGPITHTVRALEAHGVIVTRPRIDSSDVDAFSCWLGDRAHRRPRLGQGGRRPLEVRWAARARTSRHAPRGGAGRSRPRAGCPCVRRGVPHARDSDRGRAPARLSWPRYIELKARWGVSIAALLRRARDLEVITQYAYERAMVQISKKGWRTREPAAVPVEDPTLLQRALALMADTAGLDDLAVAARLRLHPDQVAELLSDVAIPARPRLTVYDGGRGRPMTAAPDRTPSVRSEAGYHPGVYENGRGLQCATGTAFITPTMARSTRAGLAGLLAQNVRSVSYRHRHDAAARVLASPPTPGWGVHGADHGPELRHPHRRSGSPTWRRRWRATATSPARPAPRIGTSACRSLL